MDSDQRHAVGRLAELPGRVGAIPAAFVDQLQDVCYLQKLTGVNFRSILVDQLQDICNLLVRGGERASYFIGKPLRTLRGTRSRLLPGHPGKKCGKLLTFGVFPGQ